MNHHHKKIQNHQHRNRQTKYNNSISIGSRSIGSRSNAIIPIILIIMYSIQLFNNLPKTMSFTFHHLHHHRRKIRTSASHSLPFRSSMITNNNNKKKNYNENLNRCRNQHHTSMTLTSSSSSSTHEESISTSSSYVPRKFQPFPFDYHQILTVKVDSLTNLGIGICRIDIDFNNNDNDADNDNPSKKDDVQATSTSSTSTTKSWVIMVPNVIPDETIKCRIYRNHKSYSEGDLIEVITPSIHRIQTPPCSLFSECGGCQYQHMDIGLQRQWKKYQVYDLLKRIGKFDDNDENDDNENDVTNNNEKDSMLFSMIQDTVGTNEIYHYRSKITPHYDRPQKVKNDDSNDENNNDNKTTTMEITAIGFKKKTNRNIIDVPYCHIATEAINEKLEQVRNDKFAEAREGRLARPKKGATLLLRDAHLYNNNHHGATTSSTTNEEDIAIVETDPNVYVQTKVKGLIFRFLAGNFFQNNPYMLPVMVDHVVDAATKPNSSGNKMTHLIDCYCGSGLFCLSSAAHFDVCVGIEVNEKAVEEATINADINQVRILK